MRRFMMLAFVVAVTIPATVPAQVKHGSVGSAIGGGAIGAFSGTIIGGVVLKPLCKDPESICWAPLLTGMVAGTFAGAYAGGTDTERVRGAGIGLGAGALVGILISSVMISSGATKPVGEWGPLPVLTKGAVIGAAIGSVIGGIVTRGESSIGTLQSVTLLHFTF